MIRLNPSPIDNASKAKDDSSRVLSPSLWIAVYDQALTFEEAFRYGYTRMTLIDANGVVAINLGINYKAPRQTPCIRLSTLHLSDSVNRDSVRRLLEEYWELFPQLVSPVPDL